MFLVLSWSPEIHSIMRSEGFDCTYILNKSYITYDLEKEMLECKRFEAKYLVVGDLFNTDELFALVSYIKERRSDFEAVLSFDESTQFAAAILSKEVFGDDRASRIYATLRDKRLMKNTLSEVVTVAKHFSPLSALKNGKIDLPSGFVYPIIVKPVNKYLSKDTYKIENNEALTQFLMGRRFSLHEYICEEYIEGSECNIDIVWINGKPAHLFLGKYNVPRLVGYDNHIPKLTTYVPYSYAQIEYDELAEICMKIAETLDIRSGMTHAEFFRSDDKWILGEIAFRHPGGAASRCISAAFGYSLMELNVRAQIARYEGMPENKYLQDNRFVGNIDVRPKTSGILKAVSDERDILALPNVTDVIYRAPLGEYVANFARDSWCTIVVAVADDKETLESALLNAHEKISFEIIERSN